ncbi:hypothetical protein [Prochlorococcus sp. MIT 1300]|uniref:hypothetical protein n=1 Tax=Prochlorococcus sp. MIT 1300 TaxID=3096218 RepID=UPI002A75BB30|nr:hypothetical protein [Prochlorococcus sp. MIT 1300]
MKKDGNSSSSSSKSAPALKGVKNESKLPFWVEILFVQIGLPDNWLRTFLKSRKRTKALISENKKTLQLIFIILLATVYIDPVIKNARLQGQCVEGAKQYLKSNNLIKSNYKNNEIELALALRFCSGGEL